MTGVRPACYCPSALNPFEMLLRLRKLVASALFGAIALAALALFGVGWHFSSVIYHDGLRVPTESRPDTAEIVSIAPSAVTLRRLPHAASGDDLGYAGQWGFDVHHGYVRMGPVISHGTRSVERAVLGVTGAVSAGDRGRVDRSDYPHDPRAALGLRYQDVEYRSPLGPMPAWFVPGRVSTWVILVHGWRVGRDEALRALPLFASRGMPALVIEYRNGRGVTRDPSGRYQFGQTEWRDLQGAVEYALSHGAKNVVIAGFSMGGAIAVNFMYRSGRASHVKALVLDSPMLDFGRTIDLGAKQRGVPRFITSIAKRLTSLRYGVNWGALDYLAKDRRLRVPILLFQGGDDKRVPRATSDELARDLPELVQYEFFPHAQHVGSWNADPDRYDRAVRAFLARVSG